MKGPRDKTTVGAYPFPFANGAVGMTGPDDHVLRFAVSAQVRAALQKLRDTGFFGANGGPEAVAEELVRWALLQPEIAAHWRKR